MAFWVVEWLSQANTKRSEVDHKWLIRPKLDKSMIWFCEVHNGSNHKKQTEQWNRAKVATTSKDAHQNHFPNQIDFLRNTDFELIKCWKSSKRSMCTLMLSGSEQEAQLPDEALVRPSSHHGWLNILTEGTIAAA